MPTLHNLDRHLGEEPETNYQKLSRGIAALDDRAAIRLIESEAARRGLRVMPEDRHRALLEAGKNPRKRLATVENIMDTFGRLNLAERRLALKQMAAELGNHARMMKKITGKVGNPEAEAMVAEVAASAELLEDAAASAA